MGISDDAYRENAIHNASLEELKELIDAVSKADDDWFDDWLAGHNWKELLHTPEYIAFSCLREAYNSADAIYF